MSSSPTLNVWTLGKGASGQWKLQLTTDTLDDATACFEEFEAQGRQVALYELGTFRHEGRQTTGQVAFRWSETLNEYMEREPEGRGTGWAEDYDTWVEYDYPEPTTEVTVGASRGALDAPRTSEPEAQYLDAACEHCGRILPMNQLRRLTHQVQTGRSSGTRRVSHSRSTGHSSRGYSSRSTAGSSASSGRAYFKTETLFLCESCYEAQRKADGGILRFLSKLITWYDSVP